MLFGPFPAILGALRHFWGILMQTHTFQFVKVCIFSHFDCFAFWVSF